MSEALVAVGWFGKLPHLGDFASRRLPDEFIHTWDEWLQHGLACARTQLGDDIWLARYLVAPIRRFWLAPQLLGNDAWTGLLMPSVDRVGRHFPLTLATALPAHVPSLARAIAAQGWFAELDAAARRVLDVDYSATDFEAALAAIEPLPELPLLDTEDTATQLAAELLQSGGEAGTCGSVWWCGNARDTTQFRCFEALPSAAASVSLLVAPEVAA